MRWLLVVLALVGCLVGCRRPDGGGPSPVSSSSASGSASASASASAPALPPPVSASAHVAVLEEVAAIHRKKLACSEVEAALAPLRPKMAGLGDVSDPRLGAAIEADADLRARRAKALEAIMDGAMRCRGDAGK